MSLLLGVGVGVVREVEVEVGVGEEGEGMGMGVLDIRCLGGVDMRGTVRVLVGVLRELVVLVVLEEGIRIRRFSCLRRYTMINRIDYRHLHHNIRIVRNTWNIDPLLGHVLEEVR